MNKKSDSNPSVTGTQRFVVRFPIGVRDRLGESARLARRSINSEILLRIENSLRTTEYINDEEPPLNDLNLPDKSAETNPLIGNLSEVEHNLVEVILKLSTTRKRSLLEFLKNEKS